MTEKTETAVRPRLYYGRFAIAFVAAPLLVTALTFWAYLIPFYALLVGGPFYAVLGLPALLWYLRRHPPEYLPILLMALIAQLVLIPVLGLMALYYGDTGPLEALPATLTMGALFASLWSTTFALLYRRLIRDL